MDKITIKEALFQCNIGVTERERKNKQDIYVDLELFSNIKQAGQEDDVNKTIKYEKIHRLIKDVAESRDFNLIESMAENMSQEILKLYPLVRLLIRVRKPGALPNTRYAAVEITRP